MVKFIPHLLTDERTETSTSALSAGVLSLLIAISAIALASGLFLSVVTTTSQWRHVVTPALLLVIAVIAKVLLHQGFMNASNIFLFGGLWSVLSGNAILYEGLYNINIAALILCMLVVGLQVKVRGIVIFGCGVMLTTCVLLFLQSGKNVTDPTLVTITSQTWFSYIIVIIAAALFTIYTSTRINRTLATLHANEQILRSKNSELEAQKIEQAKVELQLERSKSLLEATFEALADGVLVVDNNRDFVAMNKAFGLMWRLPSEVDRSEDRLQYIREQLKSPNAFMAKVSEIYADPTAETHDLVELQDGRVFDRVSLPQRMGGQIVGRVWTYRDITAMKKTEQALRESTELFRKVFELAPIGMAMGALDGQIIQVNRAFCQTVGYHASQLLSMTISQITHPDDLHTQADLRHQLLQGEIPSYQIEKRYIHQNRSIVNASVRVILIRDEAGKPLHTVAQVIDITEQKRTEEAMRQAQKLESLGIMSGGIAHDFNNLLTAILAQSSLALAQLPQESQSHVSIEKVISAANRATDLTRQLLAYSGRGQFESKPIELNKIIRDNLHLVDIAIESKAMLELALTEPLPLVIGDTGQVQQVVMNLIMNAAEAIRDCAGTISVCTQSMTIDPDAEQRYLTYAGDPLVPDTYVLLEISDNGAGMDDKTLSKIFDPFFTTKTTGRGLGLAAVLGIVRGHNGALQVESSLGEGTTFRLFFPASAEEIDAPVDPQITIKREPLDGAVLVIDDHEQILLAVQDILEVEGMEALTASDGTSGIRLFTERQSDIRLILLDLSMPGISGEETLLGLREIDSEIPIILSSGYSAVETAARIEEGNVTAFLPKPYSLTQLVDQLRQHLD